MQMSEKELQKCRNKTADLRRPKKVLSLRVD